VSPRGTRLQPVQPDLLRRSRIAFGVAAICVLFLTETVVAHQTAPSAASPWVCWGGLGAVGLGALGCGLWWRGRARRGGARGVR
jgi:hypothetical protein